MTVKQNSPLVSREIREWLLAPAAALPPNAQEPFLQQMIPVVKAWRTWMDSGGLDALLARARREAPDGVDGAEVASETWLDIRDRLAGGAVRFQAQRSLPSFSTVEEVDRYHLVQLRLRLCGRWGYRPRKQHRDIEDIVVAVPARTPQIVDARRHGAVISAAACWLAYDLKHSRNKKSLKHWWRMLHIGLDLIDGSVQGPQRNDATEAVDRLRLKLHLLGPLRPWLAALPWTDRGLSVTPPDPKRVRALLTFLRPWMTQSIQTLDVSSRERDVLQAILVRGATLRNQLKTFAPDPADRRPRLWALARKIGTRIATEIA